MVCGPISTLQLHSPEPLFQADSLHATPPCDPRNDNLIWLSWFWSVYTTYSQGFPHSDFLHGTINHCSDNNIIYYYIMAIDRIIEWTNIEVKFDDLWWADSWWTVIIMIMPAMVMVLDVWDRNFGLYNYKILSNLGFFSSVFTFENLAKFSTFFFFFFCPFENLAILNG